MSDTLLLVAVFAGILVGSWSLVLGLKFYARRTARREWRAFAHEHDFECEFGSLLGELRMSGAYGKTQVSVGTHTYGSHLVGSSSRSSTRIEAELPGHVPEDLVLYDKGLFLWKILSRFVDVDIEVGRDELDQRFLIKAQDPSRTVEFLDNESVASALVGLHRFDRRFRIEEQKLVIEPVKFMLPLRTRRALESHLERFAETVEELSTCDRQGDASMGR